MYYPKTKTVLITGAAGGIGQSLVKEYLENDYHVIALDKAESGLIALKQIYPNIHVVCADLANETEVLSKLAAYTSVDVLINNAATSHHGFLTDVSLAVFDRVYAVNVRAPFYLAKWFVSIHDPAQKGAIINIASTRALMSEKDTECYSSSKGALLALTHNLAVSLSEQNIRVNAISPGWIHTTKEELKAEEHAFHPSGRVGKPQDIAKACLFLSDPDNDFINGHNWGIDGGVTIKMLYP